MSRWIKMLLLWVGVTVAFYACGIRLYVVMSGSMEPAIPVGSICVVHAMADYETIQTGDVIAFSLGDSLVTHRVVAVTAGGLETKGDANERSDGITTDADNFRGKNLFHIPGIGYGVALCKTPSVRRFFLALLLVLLAWELWDRNDEQGDKNC